MPNKKISELPAASAPSGAELVEIVQGGINKKVTVQEISDGGDYTASEIANVAAGGISATNVQAAINELDTEKENVANKATDFTTLNNTLYPSVQAVENRVLAALAGLKWKAPVVVATTANITLSGEQTIDGVLTSSSRILVKDQSTQSQNGILITGAGAWTRSNDADSAAELEGATVTVQQGTVNSDTTWTQITDGVTLGSSNIVWTEFGSSFVLTNGNGTTADGSSVDLGGALTQNTDITGAFNFTIGQALSKIGSLEYNGTGNAWIFPDGSGQVVAGEELLLQSGATGDDSATLRCTNSAGGVMLRSSGTVIIRMDGVSPAGPQLHADYSANYTSRSLVDYAFLLSKTTGLRDLTRSIVAISAGTLTLDLDSKQERKFENTTAISSNFTLAFSNTTNAEIFSLIILITGTVAITMPSTVVMEKDDSRFVNGTKILTLIGGTAEPFELSFNKMNGLFICRSSFANYAS